MVDLKIEQKILAHCGIPNKLICLTYNHDQNIISIGTSLGLLYLYKDLDNLSVIRIGNCPINNIKFLKYSSKLIATLDYSTFILVNYDTHTILSKVTLKYEKITYSCISSDDSALICGTNKGNVYFIFINDTELELSSSAIFWNKSCKGYASVHPGSIIYLHLGESNKYLHIAFSNGIVSHWKLSKNELIRNINTLEKLYSCSCIKEDTLLFGCGNSSILYYDLSSVSMSKKPLIEDSPENKGCVWKIVSPFDIGISCDPLQFLCCGGLATSAEEDDGTGVLWYVDIWPTILSTESLVDTTFIVHNNALSVLSITAESAIIQSPPDDNSVSMETSIFTNPIEPISHIFSISLKKLSSEWIHQIYSQFAKDDGEDSSLHHSDSSVMVVTSSLSGTICLYLVHFEKFHKFGQFKLLNEEKITDLKYLIAARLLKIETETSIYLLSIFKEKPVHVTNIRISDTKDYECQEISFDAEDFPNFIQLQCIISFSNKSDKIYLISELEDGQLCFAFKDAVYILHPEKWQEVVVLDIASSVKSFVKPKTLFSKSTKRVFDTKMKIENEQHYMKSFQILLCRAFRDPNKTAALTHMFLHLNTGILVGIVLKDNQIHALESLCLFDSPILDIDLSFDKTDASGSKTMMVIISEHSIHINQLNGFQTLHIFNKPSAPFTREHNIVSDHLMVVHTDHTISCFSLENHCHLYVLNFTQHFSQMECFVVDSMAWHIVAATSSELFWIAISSDANSFKTSHIFEPKSESSILKSVKTYFQGKPANLKEIRTIRIILVSSHQGEIVANSIAATVSSKNNQSNEMIIVRYGLS